MTNILVVNVNWLGDVVFSSSVFKALRQAYPKVKISCLAVPGVVEILESIPEIDEIIIYDEERRHRWPLAKLKLIFELRRRHFDGAFLLHRSLTRAFLIFLAGIPQRVGYPTKARGIFLTHKVKTLSGRIHRADYYLNVIESFGIKVLDRKTHLVVNKKADDEIQMILGKEGVAPEDFLILVNPGGNWNLKQWPLKNFALLTDRLLSEDRGKVIVVGAQKDIPTVDRMLIQMKNKPIVLTGKLTLKQLLALMKRSNVVVSSDSGPLHLANSVGTAVIGIFGPTRGEITGPRGQARQLVLQREIGCNKDACYYLQCPDNICMQAITVEDVFNGVQELRHS